MSVPKFEDIFKQINANIRYSGIPSDDSRLGFKFYIPFFALVLMITEEVLFFGSRISSENFLELTALAPCIGIGVLSLAKIFCIALKRTKIFKLSACLEELYDKVSHDSEKVAIVKREIVTVKSLTKYYFVLNAILISVYNFSTLILMIYSYIKKGELVYKLPYAVLLPFSTEWWPNWLVVYTHSVFCGFVCVLYYTTVDALYCNLTSQVCGNFSVLSNEIERLGTHNADNLRRIIAEHQYLLKLSDDLEDIFKAPNLYNVFIGSIEICALGFNIMTGDWAQMPGFILFLLSELLQILVMSVFGENIIRESRKIGEAAFMCDWYKMDQKHKKLILTIIIRAQKPQQLTAYKYSVICYESFTKIISTSWSYFTILRTVYKPSDVIREQ